MRATRLPPFARGLAFVLLVFFAMAIGKGTFDLIQRSWFEIQVPYLGDNGFFVAVGRGIVNGLVPYRDLFETKPPAIFLLVALSIRLTGSLILARVLQCIILFALAILPAITLWLLGRRRAWLPRVRLVAACLIYGLAVALYVGQQSGELFPESFGAVFAVGYASLLALCPGRWSWKEVVASALLILFSVAWKEPFLFILLAVALILSRTVREVLVKFLLPLLVAAILGILVLAQLGYLDAYLHIYLPLLFDPYFAKQIGVPWRGIYWFLLWQNFTGYSLAWAIAIAGGAASLMVLRLPRPSRVSVGWLLATTCFFFGALRLLDRYDTVLLPVLPAFIGIIFWISAFLLMRLAERSDQQSPKAPSMLFRTMSLLLATYITVDMAGTGGAGIFLSHDFVYAVPVFFAIFSSLMASLPASPSLHWKIALTLLTILLGISVLHHDTLNYAKRLQEGRIMQQPIADLAQTIDGVLDRCREERYMLLGNTHNVYALTRHSPLGPGFFQSKLNAALPYFHRTELRNAKSAHVVVLSVPADLSGDVYAAINQHMTLTRPTCVGNITLPPGVLMEFDRSMLQVPTIAR